MTVNTATGLYHRKQFFKGFKIIFPYYAKRDSFSTSQFKCNNVLHFKSIPPYSWTYSEVIPLFIKWMTWQAYNNHELLFPLQIRMQPHQIKCSDQFRVNKRGIDCFEHMHKENTKPLVNVSVLHVWFFLFS